MGQHRILRVLKIVFFVAVATVVLGFVVMSLWNSLFPGLFGWHVITFWQALGLFVLGKILFGGFHRGCGRHNRWRERWESMTPEEREKFRAGMRGRGGCGAPPPQTQA